MQTLSDRLANAKLDSMDARQLADRIKCEADAGGDQDLPYASGLLDDLLAIRVEGREVEKQRILVWRRVVEVPQLVIGEALSLRVDVPRAHLRCGEEVSLRHQVGVNVPPTWPSACARVSQNEWP